MTQDRKLIPSGSQTVGPYFHIGLSYMAAVAPPRNAQSADIVEIRGRLLDANGVGVSDGVLEFWTCDPSAENNSARSGSDTVPVGFGRAATDNDGAFSILINRPVPVPWAEGAMQAPHMIVLVFSRGLLRHLITRVYLEGDSANAHDPVLAQIPEHRRGTLLAKRDAGRANGYQWDVILQGRNETVFFAW